MSEAKPKYHFEEVKEGEKVDENLPLKDRVIVITKTQDYKLSFQDMHNMRAMFLKTKASKEKELVRVQASIVEAEASIVKWDAEIALAIADLPELEAESGIVSPIQEGDLEEGGEEAAA